MSEHVRVGVLGPVTAWVDGAEAALGGPRQRAVLARLVAAGGRVVTADRLVEDLWDEPPQGALAAVRTFVAALRRGLEPGRTARTPARLLVTDGPGYALRGVDVDAWAFEAAVSGARDLAPAAARATLDQALDAWRGTPYAGLDQPWAVTGRARLTELRLVATERRAEVRISLGDAADVVPALDAHVAEHPWREEGWRLLALALYRSARQGDALAVLRRARAMLAGELGVDPGPRLAELEGQVLRHEVGADAASPDDVWRDTTSAYERVVAAGARGRLESTATLLRTLALTGGEGLAAARSQRVAAVRAAEQLSDPELTARVIGAFNVPGAWTRSDDADLAAEVVAAAERTLAALPEEAPDAVRSRLLATVAIESRGLPGPRGPEAARRAEDLARQAGDPAVLAFALAGRYLTAFGHTGLTPERDRIGAELVTLAARHGLSTFEILGHLVRMQAQSALGRWDTAQQHADAAAALGGRYERPLVEVFTRWFAAVRLAASGAPAEVAEQAYRDAATLLGGSGMPGLSEGLLPLAVLALRVWHGLPADGGSAGTGPGGGAVGGDAVGGDADGGGAADGGHCPAGGDPDSARWGPYAPWALPHLLLARGADADAAAAVRRIPDPPPGLLAEALWILAGRAAIAVGDRRVAERARTALTPAGDEVSAGSGVLTAGPVGDHLAALTEFLTDGVGE
ncbi:BTAD domain-containing putative transcriptional regulator [Promicromonospora iranensis]|uniref:DNA-binding SARP family transcriptional activator n=1 Tax=Promicromonospora iranensis TaxID=1105144 RepID=A0ABU2CLQ2_9MICO|nr:BTAD domain-containing putative transcriptional regulator [Promicromonospora iranensis]MDR7382272.1 DNA-binding SARP family transcriptional activator [Promicromonospora iranensis]